MTLFQGIILGIIQGIGEFLPISSSAHLVLIPWFFGWEDGGLTFDVALHAGTLLALLVYFRAEWVTLFKGLLQFKPEYLKSLDEKNVTEEQFNSRMAFFLIIATIPGAIIGFLLEKKAEHAFRNPVLIATNLGVMGLVLWLCDRKGTKEKTLHDLKLKDVLLIGFSQGLAVIPGISRAGITISTALLRGLDRESAARFSFFISMPIIAGACLLKLRHLTGADLTPTFLAGISAAAISGYLAIGGLIRFLQKQTYGIFAAYRVALGIIVWIIALTR